MVEPRISAQGYVTSFSVSQSIHLGVFYEVVPSETSLLHVHILWYYLDQGSHPSLRTKVHEYHRA